MKRMGYQPYVGLPNILAGRFVVPEILQDEATAENLAEALVKLYADKAGAAELEEVFTDIHLQLRQNTAQKGGRRRYRMPQLIYPSGFVCGLDEAGRGPWPGRSWRRR